MIIWIQKAVGFAALIMLAALGELLTEKSGGLNLGTPGTMCVGAATGFIAVFRYCQAVENPSVVMILLLTIVVSFVSCFLLGLIYGFFTVSLRINQNVVGLAMTILGCGLAEFLSIFFVQSSSGNVRCDPANAVYSALIPGLSDKLGPVSDLLFSYGFMLYVTIALTVGMTLFFTKTRTGLNLRAVGESPATADAAGINVSRYKYLASAVGSGITGVAGMYCVMEFKSGAWATADIATIQAFGWLAVALVIFAMWKPVNLLWGSLVFGICYWAYQYLPGLLNVKIPTDLAQMLPYIITILVLIIVSLRKKKENLGPASLGLTYFREER
ncbi:MAG: ABC transporter permease [Clostridia bacterium]|nr:ABC transporter permease [Clostridia bacterium]MBR4467219.1 ABC transporter permease [Clostridia bacterium]